MTRNALGRGSERSFGSLNRKSRNRQTVRRWCHCAASREIMSAGHNR